MIIECEFKNELRKYIAKASEEELWSFMEENIEKFFSSTYIYDYYFMLKEIDISGSEKELPKIIKAWLAFLSGDNAGLNFVLKNINENNFCNEYERSSFYSLKGLIELTIGKQESIIYSKMAVDMLVKDERSFFMANAKLTYGQVLANNNRYREAVEMFSDSYNLFYLANLHFLAAVAFVNEMLNRYKLGEFKKVIDESNKILYMFDSFKNESYDFWKIIHLPLGMCYYEMSKPNLAIENLKIAQLNINKLNLFHMYGMVELYLFKSYFILGDTIGMKETLNQANSFGNMHYVKIDILISMFKVLSSKENNYRQVQADIEKFELQYIKNSKRANVLIFEMLAYLKLMGLSNLITKDDLINELERLHDIGLIPYIQLFLVLLSEMNYVDNCEKEALENLKEAVCIYREYGISAAFYFFPNKSVQLLQKIDKTLYSDILSKKIEEGNNKSNLFSSREKEILELIAKGKSNKEIGKILYISTGTVKWHINQIFSKLQVKNRIQAVEEAKKIGEIRN